MSNQTPPPVRPLSSPGFLLCALLLLLVLWSAALADEAGTTGGTSSVTKAPEAEFAPRGQRMARDIKYGDWHKVCFKTPGTNKVCRTTITGTWDTGQIAVRADLIEREGDDASRLQLFLPVGLYLQAGVTLSVDQGTAWQIPYIWCLTNTCIAAKIADPKLIQEMEAGQNLALKVVDSNVLTVSTSLPLGQFAAARNSTPAQLFEQEIDE